MRRMIAAAAAASFLLATGCASEQPDSKASPGGAAKPGPPAGVSAAVLQEGRTLYKANCVSCHGETGKGDGPASGVLKPPPRDHTDRAYMSTLTDEEIGRIIKMGGAIKGKPLMPSHPQFNDNQLKALVAYVRSLSEPAKSGAASQQD